MVSRPLVLVLAATLAGCLFDHGGLPTEAPPGDSKHDFVDLSATDLALDVWPAKDLLPDGPAMDASIAPDQSVPLFWDDFSSGTSLQSDGQGLWSVLGGVYQQTACAVTHSVIPGPGWTDVAVSVKLRPNSLCPGLNRQVGLSVRATGTGSCSQWDFYACVIDVDGNKIFMCHLDNSCYCTTYGPKSTGTLKTGVWYDLTFTAQANNLTCTVAGPGIAPVTVTHTDTAPDANSSGSAGLVTSGVNVSFDDLKVEAL